MDPSDQPSFDPEAISRLLEEERDPEEPVRANDWHPCPRSPFFELDLGDTVRSRRNQLDNVLREIENRR